MTETTFGHTGFADLSVGELVRIRILNCSLAKAEHWIRQNATQLYDSPTQARETCVANLRINVYCALSESDPSFDPEGENIVATIDGQVILRAAPADDLLDSTRGDEIARRSLSDMCACPLFRELYERGVQRDCTALARIGEISVEMWRPERLAQGGGTPCGN